MLKKLPPALLASFCLSISVLVWRLIDLGFAGEFPRLSPNLELIQSGATFAAAALGVLGAIDLTNRLTGRAALGGRIAAVGFSVELVLGLGWVAIKYFVQHAPEADDPYTLFKALTVGSTVVAAITAIGLALATGRAFVFAVAAGVISCVLAPPWFVEGALFDALHLGMRSMLVVDLVPRILMTVGLLYLAVLASRVDATETVDPRRASIGLLQASRSLWLRVIASAVAAGALLVAASGSPRQLVDFVRLVSIVAPIVHIVALVGFARGAFSVARSGVADLSRWSFYGAIALSTWTAGILVARLPHLYDTLYGSSGEQYGSLGSLFQRERAIDAATSTPQIVSVISAVAVLVVLLAIARFARRRGLEEMRENASVRCAVFVVVVLGAVFLERYGLPRVSPESGLAMMLMLLMGCATLYGFMMAARLCADAAAIVDRDPGLPSARVIK